MKHATRNGPVLAHVAGPSGAGKTELMNRLEKDIHNVVLKDLDEYDDLAVEQLGWTGKDKNDYTDAELDKLHRVRQSLINNDIERTNEPIIFFGHHVEGDNVTRLPTRTKILLDVDPARSAVRVGRRPGKGLKDVQEAYQIAKEDREYLKAHGYKAESPAEVFNHLKRLAQKQENNPGILEALGRMGAFAGGLNSAIDAHDKLVKKRVIRPIIGGRKTVKRSKRNSSVAHLDLPDDIVSRLGAETIDAIFASEDPAGTIDALMTVAAAEDDYWALNDYTRLLAIMLAGGAIETEAREIVEGNPRDLVKLAELNRQMNALIDEGVMAIYRGDQTRKREVLQKQAKLQRQINREQNKNPGLFGEDIKPKHVQTTGYCLGCTVDYGKGTGVVTQSFRDVDGVQWFEVKPQRGGLQAVRASDVRIEHNPTYTVHVSTPSVNESVEVKGPFLTTGGALRRGKHRLRSAAKVQPKWSVERNPYPYSVFRHLWEKECDSTKPYFSVIATSTGIEHKRLNDKNEAAALAAVLSENSNTGETFYIVSSDTENVESNPTHKRGRKGGSYALLVNPYATDEQLIRAQDNTKRATAAVTRLRYLQRQGQATREQVINAIEDARREKQYYNDLQKRTKNPEELAPATKSKLNKVSSTFHGPGNPAKGRISREYISDHVKARNFSRAGSIPGIKLEIDATGKHADPSHICEECTILTNPNTSKLGISTGLRVQLMGNGVHAAGKRLKNKLDRMSDEQLSGLGVKRERNGGYDLGKANTQWYTTIEKWSDVENPDLVNYFHEWAEETKRYEDKPNAKIDENGMIYFRGGKHKVTSAGIEN